MSASRPPQIEKLMSEMFPSTSSSKLVDVVSEKRRSTQPKFASNLRPRTQPPGIPETKISTPSSRWKISIKSKKKGETKNTPTDDAIRRHLGLSRAQKSDKKKKSTKKKKGVPRFMRNTKSRDFALRSPRSPRSLRDPKIKIAKRTSFTSSLRKKRLNMEKRAIRRESRVIEPE